MCQQPANAAAGNLAQIIHSGVAANAVRASGAWRQNGVACFLAHFAAADQAGLVRIIKRKLKKIQYRPI